MPKKWRKSAFAPARELSLEQFLPARDEADGDVKIEIADWSHLPDDQRLQSEMEQVLDRAMGDLPEIYRAVVLPGDLEELSTEETAHILDVTDDTVKQRLHRARPALRKTLDEHLRADRHPVTPGPEVRGG